MKLATVFVDIVGRDKDFQDKLKAIEGQLGDKPSRGGRRASSGERRGDMPAKDVGDFSRARREIAKLGKAMERAAANLNEFATETKKRTRKMKLPPSAAEVSPIIFDDLGLKVSRKRVARIGATKAVKIIKSAATGQVAETFAGPYLDRPQSLTLESDKRISQLLRNLEYKLRVLTDPRVVAKQAEVRAALDALKPAKATKAARTAKPELTPFEAAVLKGQKADRAAAIQEELKALGRDKQGRVIQPGPTWQQRVDAAAYRKIEQRNFQAAVNQRLENETKRTGVGPGGRFVGFGPRSGRNLLGRLMMGGPSFGEFAQGSLQIGAGIIGARAGLAAISAPYTAMQKYAGCEQSAKGVEVLLRSAGETKEAIEAAENAVRKMGKTTIYAATESADQLQELVRVGYSSSQSLQLLKASMDAAAATDTNLGESVQLTTSILKAFGKDASYAGRLSDILTQSTNTTSLGMSDLGQALKYVGVASAQVGVSIEDTVAAIAAANERGLTATQMGRGLRGVFAQLARDDVQQAFRDIKVEVTNTDGSLRSIVDIMDDFNRSTAGTAGLERIGMLFNRLDRVAGTAFAAMASGVDTMKRVRAGLAGIGGVAGRQAEERMSTLSNQAKLMKSAFVDLAITLGSLASGPLKDVVKGLTDALNNINNLLPKLSVLGGDTSGGTLGLLTRLGFEGLLAYYMSRGIGTVFNRGASAYRGAKDVYKHGRVLPGGFDPQTGAPVTRRGAAGMSGVWDSFLSFVVGAASKFGLLSVAIGGAIVAIGEMSFKMNKANEELVKARLASVNLDTMLALKKWVDALLKTKDMKPFRLLESEEEKLAVLEWLRPAVEKNLPELVDEFDKWFDAVESAANRDDKTPRALGGAGEKPAFLGPVEFWKHMQQKISGDGDRAFQQREKTNLILEDIKQRLGSADDATKRLSEQAEKKKEEARVTQGVVSSTIAQAGKHADAVVISPGDSGTLVSPGLDMYKWLFGWSGKHNNKKQPFVGPKLPNRRRVEGVNSPGFQSGGKVSGPNNPPDRVLALLSGGEAVLNTTHQRRLGSILGTDGASVLGAIGVPGFQEGGSVWDDRNSRFDAVMSRSAGVLVKSKQARMNRYNAAIDRADKYLMPSLFEKVNAPAPGPGNVHERAVQAMQRVKSQSARSQNAIRSDSVTIDNLSKLEQINERQLMEIKKIDTRARMK